MDATRDTVLNEELQNVAAEGPRKVSVKISNVVVTRMSCDRSVPLPSPVIPCADAFNVIVQLRDFRSHRLWRGEELVFEGGHPKGAISITDLREEWQCHHLSPFDNVRFHIPFSHIRSFAEDIGRPEFSGFECRPGTMDNVVLGLAQALLPALENPGHASQLFLEQVNLAMLTHLTQTYGGLHFPSGKKGVLAPWQERRAIDFLAAHVTAPFSIADLATECQLSRSYFIKAFKESFGRTPYRWLIEYRIGLAKDMLARGMAIAEVAVSCGFSDQSHLTRVFSDIVGVSPGTWRRNGRPF